MKAKKRKPRAVFQKRILHISISLLIVGSLILILAIQFIRSLNTKNNDIPPQANSLAIAAPSCTHTYTSTLNQTAIPPGSVICIDAAKKYTTIKLSGLQGTKDRPITIINQGGQVKISGGSNVGIELSGSKFFRFTGSGVSTIPYGFFVSGNYHFGARIDNGSSDFEFDHIEIAGVSNRSGTMIGLSTKTKAEENRKCTGFTPANFTQTNTVIHDTYVHTVPNEAMYIGSNDTLPSGTKLPCGLNPVLKGLMLYNNRVSDFGKDGLNVKGTPESCQIYNNIVEKDSRRKLAEQSGGIAAVLNTKCDIFNNTVRDGWGPGIQDNGNGGNTIYNNTISNAGRGGIPGKGFGVQIQNTNKAATSVIIKGNTITNPATKAIEPGTRGIVQ